MIFGEGLRNNQGWSILSTICLLNKDDPTKSYEEFIEHYDFGGKSNVKVLIHIPQELEGLYLGNCKLKFGNSGNQNDKNHILDYLNLDNIPREFIVGLLYSQNYHVQNTESQDFKFFDNPFYYDYVQNKEENIETIVNKIKEGMNKSSFARDIISGKNFSNDHKEFLKNLGDLDKLHFINQREEYDRKKELDMLRM